MIAAIGRAQDADPRVRVCGIALSGAHVDGVGRAMLGIDGDGPDRHRARVVGQGLPRCTLVPRTPDTTIGDTCEQRTIRSRGKRGYPATDVSIAGTGIADRVRAFVVRERLVVVGAAVAEIVAGGALDPGARRRRHGGRRTLQRCVGVRVDRGVRSRPLLDEPLRRRKCIVFAVALWAVGHSARTTTEPNMVRFGCS